MKKSSIKFSLSSVMALVGCSTSIRNKSNIDNVIFEIGKTDKSTVVKTLGWPDYISKSEALGREYWAYHAKPEPTKIICAGPNAAGIVKSYMFPSCQAGGYEYDDADVVYVFDRNGLMVDVRQPW